MVGPRRTETGEGGLGMVKVEVLAEQLSYSQKNADGTHTRADYVRGQVLEMDEESALQASEGEASGSSSIQKNSAGTPVWIYPPKTPGVARAAVRIVASEAKVSEPVKKSFVTPAPAPKPASSKNED